MNKNLHVTNFPKYSVMMLVYYKADAEHLRESLDSMFNQTLAPDEVLLVCDGKLTSELDSVIEEKQAEWKDVFRVIRLDRHIGIGAAANIGINEAKNEIIVRMDADDVSLPERCSIEISEFVKNPELDLIGGFITEGDTDNVKFIREVPLAQEEMIRFARRRSPVNNVTLAFKKSTAQRCGGYRNMSRCEDYDFVCRMLTNGAVCKNIPVVLVHCRIGKKAFSRRKSWENTKAFISVRRQLRKNGFSRTSDYISTTIAQLLLFILPVSFTSAFYKLFLRKKYRKGEKDDKN